MKKLFKILFLIILVSCCNIQAQNINIPDTNLKNWLLQSSNLIPIAYNMTSYCDGVYVKIDANNDGEIQQNEADNVISLSVGERGVTNLTGIEHFTNLCYLSCLYSNISNVNLVGLTNMKGLNIALNNVSNIDLSLYPNLEYLYCSNNNLSSLNFSNLPNLKEVYCGNNQLTSLNFSNNPQFTTLSCEYNNLTNINIQNGNLQTLVFPNPLPYNMCWGNNPNLNQICADPNEIIALNSFLSSCGINQPITVDSSCSLAISTMDPNTISLYPNPSNGIFNLDLSKLPENYTNLEVYDILGKKIQEQKLLTQKGIIINISHLESANYIAKIFNSVKSINIQLIKK
jgi:Leucine-rich repeat (LRR) protein